jgi:hypothetical protein
MSSLRTWLARAAVVAAMATATATARAQGAGEQAAAEALFKQGRDLMNAGRFAEACPMLAESERLDPAAGTLLNLATCYERSGQLASAWATYKDAATAAQRADQQERAQLARRKAGELETKLPTLTIVVPAAADRPDLQIKRDGDIVGRPAWGAAIPVDPGAHTIEATAAGRKPWHGQASVEGPGVQNTVEVPPLEIEPAIAPGPVVPPSPPPADAAVRPEPAIAPVGRSGGSGQRAVAIALGSVGLAGVVVGAVFGGIARSDNNDAKGHCLIDSACDAQGMSSTSSAQHAATASTIAFTAGGVLVATGVVLYLTAPSGASAAGARVGLSPLVGAAVGGIALQGGW